MQTSMVVFTVRRQASLHCHSLLGVPDPQLAPRVSASDLGKLMLGLILFQVSISGQCSQAAKFVGMYGTQCQPLVLVLHEVYVLHAVVACCALWTE